MKITIIVGSSRKDSQSKKVGLFIQNLLSEKSKGLLVELVNVGDINPMCWLEGSDSQLQTDDAVLKKLEAADAVIVIAPEWNGMAPPALKNLLLVCDKQLAHKPGLLIGVSAGLGGSYPIMELRSSGYKNTKICYIPDHLIIRNVTEMLNASEAASEEDEKLRERLFYSLGLLELYAASMKVIRASESIDLFRYPYGM